MLKILTGWPDEILSNPPGDAASSIALFIRLGRISDAESLLLVEIARSAPSSDDYQRLLWLRAYFLFLTHQSDIAISIVQSHFTLDHYLDRILQTLSLLHSSDTLSLKQLPPSWWHEKPGYSLLRILNVSTNILLGDLAGAFSLIEATPNPLPMELVRYKARILGTAHQYSEALELILPAATRFPQNISLQCETLDFFLKSRDNLRTVPFLRDILGRHGPSPSLFKLMALIKQYQNEPANALRYYLIHQTYASTAKVKDHQPGVVVSYEQLGLTTLLDNLSDDIHTQPAKTSAIRRNLCMYYASTCSAKSQSHTTSYVAEMMHDDQFLSHQASSPQPELPQAHKLNMPLRVAWLTGDLNYHPVSRFLLNLFDGVTDQPFHDHFLVSLFDHGRETISNYFQNVPFLSHLDISQQDPDNKLATLRSNEFDVAIDLSGWTDNNFITGFMARLAPIQINYLGYFASTGLPTMDFWLGDNFLFPTACDEWHTEALYRMNRCFLSWLPSPQLPEADVDVTSAPTSPDIIFGSFNHNRKLTTKTLLLWSRILDQVPNARLVLKPSSQSDQNTQAILRRRLQACGIDLCRIIWLPRAENAVDHLYQYRYLDIALDPTPNGGCTTTCEALWMGVPVITLVGNSYVSRMSHAVLNGANISYLSAETEDSYVTTAVALASDIKRQRSNRPFWRTSIIESPLGNPSELMRTIEGSLSSMYSSRVNQTHNL